MTDVFQPNRDEIAKHLELVLGGFAEQAASGVNMRAQTAALAEELAGMMVRLAADSMARGEQRGYRLAGAVASMVVQ